LASSNGDQRIATEKRDQSIATEKSSDQMIVTWVIVAAVVVAVGVAVVVWLRKGPSRVDPLAGLVIDALGADWADRTGADVETVRSAALHGQPAQVRSHLAALIEDVEVGFESDGAGPVRISVRCKYADGTSETTATMDVPWEKVPQEVRAQFLRSGDKTVSRHWSVS
jgi:hypothetical protein